MTEAMVKLPLVLFWMIGRSLPAPALAIVPPMIRLLLAADGAGFEDAAEGQGAVGDGRSCRPRPLLNRRLVIDVLAPTVAMPLTVMSAFVAAVNALPVFAV